MEKKKVDLKEAQHLRQDRNKLFSSSPRAAFNCKIMFIITGALKRKKLGSSGRSCMRVVNTCQVLDFARLLEREREKQKKVVPYFIEINNWLIGRRRNLKK